MDILETQAEIQEQKKKSRVFLFQRYLLLSHISSKIIKTFKSDGSCMKTKTCFINLVVKINWVVYTLFDSQHCNESFTQAKVLIIPGFGIKKILLMFQAHNLLVNVSLANYSLIPWNYLPLFENYFVLKPNRDNKYEIQH